MSPEYLAQFEDMKQRLEALENARNINALKLQQDYLIKDAVPVTDTDIEVEIPVSGGGGGTVTAPDFPDYWLRVIYNGQVYRCAAYLERLDSSR